MPTNCARKVWGVVAVALSATALACSLPAPELGQSFDPVPTLQATPDRPPAFPPGRLYIVDRTESSLAVVWNDIYNATHYEAHRSDSEHGDYALAAAAVDTLGFVDEGLRPNTVYFYLVKACNQLGCSTLNDEPVAGITESDAEVDVPAAPKDVRVVRKRISLLPDWDEVSWAAVEGATYYEIYRAGYWLTKVSAPLTRSSHTDLGRSASLSFSVYYEVRACNKAGCSHQK